MNFESGHIIGAYKLLLKCGQGAYGPVYLAENTLTGKQAALKIVAMTGSNFERELQGVIRYQQIAPGSGLLQIYHVEQQGDFFYYTMDAADNLSELPDEYIPDTLGNRLRRYGKLDPASVQIMAESLLKSLQILHSKKLCHRDIKPDNILFINGIALPGDVGLISDNASATQPAGTLGFIPPEVAGGLRAYEFADDYYALGKVIYCALTGFSPGQYPEFPPEITLAEAGALITLYNQLINHGTPPEPRPDDLPKPKIQRLKLILLLAAIAATLILWNWHGDIFSSQAPQPGKLAALPEPATTPAPQELYPAPDGFESVHNRVRLRYRDLFLQKQKLMWQHWNQPFSAAEQTRLDQLPEPERAAQKFRLQAARQQKHEQSINDKFMQYPEWQYHLLCDKIILEEQSSAPDHARLYDLYRQKQQLEYILLKKYQKNSNQL